MNNSRFPIFTIIALFFNLFEGQAQSLSPGFDKEEMLQVMYVSVRAGGVTKYYADSNFVPEPSHFKMAYRSPVIGLKNLYEIWTHDKTAVISVRGTTMEAESWMANFYAAMVPAKGSILMSPTDSFHYQVASDPKAAVHAGWMLSTAYIARDLQPRLDSLYDQGCRNLIVTGHSQGGGISYLLTAYLYNQQKLKLLPADIRIKTYSTAAPKPGNLYFAYEYEAATQGGWAFNVLNTSDWVPEMPFSIQTTDDFNTVNPFRSVSSIIKKQSFKNRIIYNTLYKKLSKPPKHARDRYRKFLGDKFYPQVAKTLPEYQKPDFYNSSNYTRAGTPVILSPDESYSEKYKDNESNFWMHHMHHPYIYLIQKMKH
jgi:hypothetical protein